MIRALTFIFIGLIGTSILYALGDTIAQPYEGSKARVEHAIASKDTIKVITLGNSHAGGIHFPTLGKSGDYLHGGFFDVFELEYVAEYLIPNLDSLQEVYIPVPFYIFQFDNGARPNNDYQTSFRIRSYYMVPRWKLITNDWKNLLKAKLAPIIRPDYWENVVITLLEDEIAAIAVERPISTAADSAYIEKHGIGRTKENVTQVKEMKEFHPSIESDAYKSLKNVVQLLKAHDIQPIFFTPPYYQSYLSNYPFEQKRIHQKLWERFLLETKVRYFDFSHSEAFKNDYQWFVDSDHLNLKGRIRFSKMLNDSLRFHL